LWFNLHRAFNTTAFGLLIALFSIAVALTAKEGGGHFFNSHEKVGLVIFIMTTLQVMGGIFRPHLPPPGSVDEEKTTVRKGWEGGHRLSGVALLTCGFWQMQEGLKLYVIKYTVSEDIESKVGQLITLGIPGTKLEGEVLHTLARIAPGGVIRIGS
jgi:hypothetical protein